MTALATEFAAGAKSDSNGKLHVPPEYVAKAESVVQSALPFLSRMWNEMAGTLGMWEPRFQPYRERVASGCGPVEPGNASYCKPDNTIYYDPAFLALVMSEAGSNSGSDGSYAVVAILEHELGHAIAWRRDSVQSQLSALGGSLTANERESYADCAAGAMSARARQLGLIGSAATIEAERMLDIVADHEIQIEEAHGDPAARLRAFRQGYQQGTGSISACKIVRMEKRFQGGSGDATESCSDYGREHGLQAQLRASALGICK